MMKLLFYSLNLVQALVLFITFGGLLSTVPCPIWDDAVYANGKCFKVFQTTTSWFMAQNNCNSLREFSMLAEPRSVEEIKALTSLENVGWVGARSHPGPGKTYLYDSDSSAMDFLGHWDPGNTRCKGPCCIRMREGLYRDCVCNRQHGGLCEINVSQRYVIPLHGLKTINSNSSIFPDLSLEIVAATVNIVVDIRITFYPDEGAARSSSINVSDSNPVAVYDIVTFGTDSSNNIQLNCIEFVTSHPVIITLVYKSSSPYIRQSLYPSSSDVTGINGNETSTFVLVSSSESQYIKLCIVSLNPGVTNVSIAFKKGDRNDDYIVMDSIQFRTPQTINVSLAQFQGINIKGKLCIDGTKVVSSQEIAVYVIINEDQNWAEASSLSDIYQAVPVQFSSLDYVTFPSDVIEGYDFYKIVTLEDKTTIQANNQNYYLEYAGAFDVVGLPKYRSSIVSGNRPFQMYKIYNTTTHNDNGVTDRCIAPLVPQTLWQSRYTLSTEWMESMEQVTLLLVMDYSMINNFTVNGEIQSLNCSGVKDSDEMAVCLFDVLKYLASNSSLPSVLPIRVPGRFTAYIFWNSGGYLHCQTLLVLWAGGQTLSKNGTLPFSLAVSSINPPMDFTTLTTLTVINATTTPITPVVTTITEQVCNSTCPGPVPSVLPNITYQELQNRLYKTRQLLYINYRETSKFIRKKTSATDSRSSSIAIGYVGVVFIFIVLSALIISDIINIVFKPSLVQTKLIDRNSRSRSYW